MLITITEKPFTSRNLVLCTVEEGVGITCI